MEEDLVLLQNLQRFQSSMESLSIVHVEKTFAMSTRTEERGQGTLFAVEISLLRSLTSKLTLTNVESWCSNSNHSVWLTDFTDFTVNDRADLCLLVSDGNWCPSFRIDHHFSVTTIDWHFIFSTITLYQQILLTCKFCSFVNSQH